MKRYREKQIHINKLIVSVKMDNLIKKTIYQLVKYIANELAMQNTNDIIV